MLMQAYEVATEIFDVVCQEVQLANGVMRIRANNPPTLTPE